MLGSLVLDLPKEFGKQNLDGNALPLVETSFLCVLLIRKLLY